MFAEQPLTGQKKEEEEEEEEKKKKENSHNRKAKALEHFASFQIEKKKNLNNETIFDKRQINVLTINLLINPQIISSLS